MDSASSMFKPSFSAGNIMFVLFASIGMVGLIGVTGMNLMKGPIRAMSQVTKRTIAENHMIASGKLALIMSAQQTGDCDEDGLIEPLEWVDPVGKPAPLNGGLLPSNIGAALQDPWGNPYGYCSWDHGTKRQDNSCGTNANRLEGDEEPSHLVIAIISSGPDKVYQTGCQGNGHADYLLRVPGGDDVVLAYTFAEAMTLAGGLWNLRLDDSDTATIAKNLSVTDESGVEQFSFDASSKALSIGSGGTGELPNIRTDYIQSLTNNAPIEFLTNIKTGSAWISGDGSNKGVKIAADGKVDLSGDVEAAGKVLAGSADISTAAAHAVAAVVTSSGTDGIGLKASGTSKAIESAGLLDMTTHNIINLAQPAAAQDAATKKYVDDEIGNGKTKCEAFSSSSCLGGSTTPLDKSSLGACKKACEDMDARCCYAAFPLLGNNPEAELATCTGYSGNSQPIGTRLLTVVLGTVASWCYKQ